MRCWGLREGVGNVKVGVSAEMCISADVVCVREDAPCMSACLPAPDKVAVGVVAVCSVGFLDQEDRAALAPPWGKLDRGVAAELGWKPGMTLVSRGEKTAMAVLFAAACEAGAGVANTGAAWACMPNADGVAPFGSAELWPAWLSCALAFTAVLESLEEEVCCQWRSLTTWLPEQDVWSQGNTSFLGSYNSTVPSEFPTAMVLPSSLHAMECRGRLVLTDAATLLDRRSKSMSCSSRPADASTCGAVRKLTELAAALCSIL